jgi:hypothetical protein
MAGIPKVKIQFDADLDGLKKGTAAADKEVGGFADKVGEFGKKAAAAFAVAAAAAAAYAVKLAVDGVKAAIEDEQAQLKLANALEAATGATNAQIKAVEDQILKTSLATGVADDKLRPALQRLATATGDTEKAQKLLNLALDISAATGKPLETVSNALGKAYEGNTTALVKLNAGISTADAKTLGYTGALQQLTDLYGGAAAKNADTFQGRIDRVKVAFDETKESIGQALLPIVEKLLGFITGTVLPVFQKFSDALSGSGEGILGRFTAIVNYIRDFVEPIFNAVRGAFVKIGDAIRDQQPRFKEIVERFQEIFDWLDKYIVPILKTTFVKAIETFASAASTAIKVVVPVVEGVYNAIKTVINGIISVINTAIGLYNTVNNLFGGKDISKIQKIGEVTGGGTSSRVGGVELPFGGATLGGATGASGNALGSGIISSVGSAVGKAVGSAVGASAKKVAATTSLTIPTTTVPTMPISDSPFFNEKPFMGDTINLTVNGAIDPESTARQIVTILNDSQARGTRGASAFSGLVQI